MGAHGFPSRSERAATGDQRLWPLEPILAHYGAELSEGRWGEQQICCPVHGERRPSLRVNAEKGVFFCHACEARGTAVHLVMLMEGCGRADALQRTAAILKAAGYETKKLTGRSRYRRPGGRRYVPPGRRSA